jgi:LysR family transcriptional regulator, nitrogen assimilation regulatory protein
MNIHHLENFLRIVELRSMTKAAVVVRIAQPALSRQIKALEAEIGTALFERHGWGVTLTPAGVVLAEHADNILKAVKAARQATQQSEEEPGGELSFGAIPSFALPVLHEIAIKFRHNYPKVKLRLVEAYSAHVLQQTLTKQLDAAVLYDARLPDEIDSTPLLSEKLGLVAPPDRLKGKGVLKPQELADLPLIISARPNRLRLLVENACLQCGMKLNPIMEVDALPTLLELVSRGEGYTLLPYSSVHDRVRAKKLTFSEIDGNPFSRTLVMARASGNRASPSLFALTRELQILVRENATALRWTPLFSEVISRSSK